MSGSDSDLQISVLMPAYNAERYIALAIESILNQTFKDFEFIIVDDGSTDNTPSIIQDFAKKDKRIVPVRHKENLEICRALNTGIELARGKYIARMDADDWSYPNRLEKQYKFMEKHPEVGISGGSMEIINKNGKQIGIRRYNLTDVEIRKKIFRYSPFSHPLIIIRKNILDKTGFYNPNLVYAEDYDLYFRIGKFAKFDNLDNILLKYRMLKENSTSKRLREMELKTLAIRKKAVREYGYKMSLVDKIYLILQYSSILIIPPKIKIWLFNFLRNNEIIRL